MISFVFEIFTFLIGTYLTCLSVKKLLKGKYSMLHICVIIFYVMQILPIFVSYFGSTSKIEKYYKYMYLAMQDELVSIVYTIFSILTIVVLWKKAQKYAKTTHPLPMFKIKNMKVKKIIIVICLFSMNLPILGVFFSPNPLAYLEFSYFTMNRYGNIVGAIYHTNVLSYILMLSFSATILFYFINPDKKNITLFYTALITWISGKRTLMMFLLIIILIIDFLNWDRVNRKVLRKIVQEAIIFSAIIIAYYIFYKNFTGKSDFADWFLLYSTYFSRLSNVKVAIYDWLYTKQMIAYPFETLIFNVLFFIPRKFWITKPMPFFIRFAYYTLYGSGLEITNENYIGWYFQVNIWTEFITNAGIIGWILSILLVIKIIHFSENNDNKLIALVGSSFCFLYMMYGFEHIVQIIFSLFIFLLILEFFKKHIKLNIKNKNR